MSFEDFIEISEIELKVIKCKDIENLNDDKCIKRLNLTKKEFNIILKSARKKCATSVLENKLTKIKKEEEIILEDVPTTLCTFRCATCGRIYIINYFKEVITCPNCNSKKIMNNKDAGFCK